MKWGWRPESDPPPAQAAVGADRDRALALLAAVERLDATARTGLLLSAHADTLVVAAGAPGAALPWTDGAIYLAPRAEAPALWLPTTERPELPLDLLQRAVERRHRQSPWALLRAPSRLLPLHRALPAGDGLIARIRAHWRA